MFQTKVYCEECGRELTDADSIARRIGPDCAAKAAQAFGSFSLAMNAVNNGTKDTRLELRIKEFQTLARIKAAKEASGFVAPKLIRDLLVARNAVITRAQQLAIIKGGQNEMSQM